jgi:hypothetical protein
VDSAGNVYVADGGNNTIRKVTAAGVVTTIGGTPGIVGSSDGVSSAAGFNFPLGVEVDPAGNIYVADSGNNVIRVGRPIAALRVVLSSTQVILSWPAPASGFVLESSPALGAAADWQPFTDSPAILGNQFVVTGRVNSAATFYRLHQR